MVMKRPSQAASPTGWMRTSWPAGGVPSTSFSRPQVSRLSPKTMAPSGPAPHWSASPWSFACRMVQSDVVFAAAVSATARTSEWASPQT